MGKLIPPQKGTYRDTDHHHHKVELTPPILQQQNETPSDEYGFNMEADQKVEFRAHGPTGISAAVQQLKTLIILNLWNRLSI